MPNSNSNIEIEASVKKIMKKKKETKKGIIWSNSTILISLLNRFVREFCAQPLKDHEHPILAVAKNDRRGSLISTEKKSHKMRERKTCV